MIHEKCTKCGKIFKLGDSIYEGGFCKECDGKGFAIAGIVSKEFLNRIKWC